ncbi:MAG: hypothetical protein HYU98_05025 [Deltaproteobacteria bacterium]|nr:hypothetical protein [Deltaproteobacteria bacterium]
MAELLSENAPIVPPPTISTSAQKLTYRIGPFSLPAGQKALTMWDEPGFINFQTDEPLWVISFEDALEESTGAALPRNLLHMAILTNRSENNPLCTEKEVANPFVATSAVTEKMELPKGLGYAVLPDDQLDAKVILKNPTAQDFNDVFYKFTITALPMKTSKNIDDVMPLLLDIDPCDHMPISLPPKEFTKKEADFLIPENGLLTKAYGLLQNNGIGVSLSESSGIIWESNAALSEKHEIISLPEFDDPAGIPLNAGDKIRLSVSYENMDSSWHSDATGAVMAYLKRSDPSP